MGLPIYQHLRRKHEGNSSQNNNYPQASIDYNNNFQQRILKTKHII